VDDKIINRAQEEGIPWEGVEYSNHLFYYKKN